MQTGKVSFIWRRLHYIQSPRHPLEAVAFGHHITQSFVVSSGCSSIVELDLFSPLSWKACTCSTVVF